MSSLQRRTAARKNLGNGFQIDNINMRLLFSYGCNYAIFSITHAAFRPVRKSTDFFLPIDRSIDYMGVCGGELCAEAILDLATSFNI